MSKSLSVEDDHYAEILTAIVKRFVRLVDAPAAVSVARRIPKLMIDDHGNVLDYDRDNPVNTILLLISQYRIVFGDIALTLSQQTTHLLITGDNSLPGVSAVSSALGPPLRLVLVDDHLLFREGLVRLLTSQPSVQVTGTARSVREAVEMTGALEPDIVLMEFGLSDGSGVEATRAILTEWPKTKIVFVTFHEEDEYLFEVIRAGAVGYIVKSASLPDLVETLRAVARGEAGISRTMTRRILKEFARLPSPSLEDQSDPTTRLTPREIEVIREIASGATNQEIAQRLYISENTVRNHVSHVLARLHLRDRRDIVDYASRHGLLL